MAAKVQMSLSFDDEELFNNFIVPCKDDKILNQLMIRCLSAYYYDEEVRNRIEGSKAGNPTDSMAIQSICDGIKDSLLMQVFVESKLEDACGVDEVLCEINETAVKLGLAKPVTSEYGSCMLRASMPANKFDLTVADKAKPAKAPETVRVSKGVGKDVQAVKKYADSLLKGIVPFVSGVERLNQYVQTLETEKAQLQSTNAVLKSKLEKLQEKELKRLAKEFEL